MGQARVFDIDQVLRSVDQLMEAIDADAEKQLFNREGAPLDLGTKGAEAFESLVERTVHGVAELWVSPDDMEATANFYPPLGDGRPLTFDDLAGQLAARGISEGILEGAVRDALLAVALDQRPIEDVVVARGQPPVDELPERWELDPEHRERKRLLDERATFLDFKT